MVLYSFFPQGIFVSDFKQTKSIFLIKKTIIMKKQIILLMSGLMLVMASCDKATTDPTPDPTPTPSSPTPPTPTVANSDGVLVSLMMNMTQNNPNLPIPIEVTTEIGLAVFPTTNGGSTYKDVGSVKVNSIALEKGENNSYLKSATMGLEPSSMEFNSGSKWSVSQLGIDYNHDVPFPKYSGELPSVVTRTNGLTIDLAGPISGAPDSVMLFIATQDHTLMKTVQGNSASVSFTASELSVLSAVSDKTAYLEVIPYRITSKQINGKLYHFLKEYASVTVIEIK